MKWSLVAAMAVVISAAGPLAGQGAPDADLVDRVVAVVGDSVVLESEIMEQIERRRAYGEQVPSEGEALEALKRQELEALVNEMLILHAAVRDSVPIAPEDVQAQVTAALAEQDRRFGGRAAFEAALGREGLTIEQYRRTVERSMRRAGLQQLYMALIQRERRPPPVTDAEIRAFFQQRAEELGTRPASIEFEQVIVVPRAADAALAEARAEAEEVRERLLRGEDFGQLARRHSADPGSRERGGELGWVRRGRMVAEFERMAFAIRQGEISPVVETSFGFHIIKVDRVRGAERQVRHILIRPDISTTEQARTQDRAVEAGTALRGGAAIDSLRRAVRHDASEQGRVGPVVQDSLPAPYNSELRGVRTGDIVGPFRLPGPTETYAIARVLNVIPAGEYTTDDQDVRDQIRRFLQQEKLMEEVLGELRRRTYVDIRY